MLAYRSGCYPTPDTATAGKMYMQAIRSTSLSRFNDHDDVKDLLGMVVSVSACIFSEFVASHHPLFLHGGGGSCKIVYV